MARVRLTLAALVLAWLTLVARRSDAHPLLQDRLEIVAHPGAPHAVDIVVTSALRTTLTSLGREPHEGAFYSPDEVARAVADGLPYLLAHLYVEIDDVPVAPVSADAVLTAPVTQPVHRLLDTEKVFSRATLHYSAAGAARAARELAVAEGTHVTISHSMLTDVVDASGARWTLDYVIADAPGGPRVLRAGEATELLLGAGAGALPGASRGATFTSFLREGALHILGGFDHLLFLAAIVLGVRRARSLWLVVGAFTIAHTVTLALATLGVVRVPGAIVEPLIGVSIVVAAALSLTSRADREVRGERARVATAFGFGLVHGLGFASGLDAALGGGRAHLALALASFTLGIELVQQGLVLPAFFAVRALRRRGERAARVLEWATLIVIVLGVLFVVQALKRGG